MRIPEIQEKGSGHEQDTRKGKHQKAGEWVGFPEARGTKERKGRKQAGKGTDAVMQSLEQGKLWQVVFFDEQGSGKNLVFIGSTDFVFCHAQYRGHQLGRLLAAVFADDLGKGLPVAPAFVQILPFAAFQFHHPKGRDVQSGHFLIRISAADPQPIAPVESGFFMGEQTGVLCAQSHSRRQTEEKKENQTAAVFGGAVQGGFFGYTSGYFLCQKIRQGVHWCLLSAEATIWK